MTVNFEKIGISGRDKRIYEFLLLHPQASVRSIAEATGVNRGSVFESLKHLIAIGLVGHIKKGQRIHYSAHDPEVLHEITNDRSRELRSLHASIDRYIASLPAQADETEAAQFIFSYEGDEGIAAILRDLLTTARREGFSHYYAISSPRVSAHMYDNFPYFNRERDQLGLTAAIIGLGTPLRTELPSVHRRVIDSPAADNGVYTLIYGNKLALIYVDELRLSNGIIIDNPAIASLHRLLFERTWASLEQ